MRLSKIEIHGYRRFVDAHVYVGRKVLALVGPNEAGKSSLLSLLSLCNDNEPIPPERLSRAIDMGDPKKPIAVLTLDLDSEERALVSQLPLETIPSKYVLTKLADGTRNYTFAPLPEYALSILGSLKAVWDRLYKDAVGRLEASKQAEGVSEDEQTRLETVEAALSAASAFLTEGAKQPPSGDWQLVRGWVKESTNETKVFAAAVDKLDSFVENNANPISLNRRLEANVGTRFPKFLEFGTSHRDLRHEYELDVDQPELLTEAVSNLLSLAGTTPEEVLKKKDDDSRRATLQNNANERLKAFFQLAWGQNALTVELIIEPDILRVFVRDLNEHHTTAKFSDRSDGLRLFVSLATFLKAKAPDTPPVLLIDEAEQHLHLNAQADLVNLLQRSPEITQVIYTTHSPACLPSDLGSGVRFVEPNSQEETSLVRHDFWSESNKVSLGFSPLLFVMGAGAAAFTTVRNALVAEGPSDMLLLPTMIRIANDLAELDYQVAPGIAIASRESLAMLNETASRVAYVVDGDAGGNAWEKDLVGARIAQSAIYKLPKNVGVEDLFEKQFYVETVNNALSGSGKTLKVSQLASGPIKSAMETWAAANQVKPLGSVAMAELILGHHESGDRPIALSARGVDALRALHAWTTKRMTSS